MKQSSFHHPPEATPSPLNGERAGVRGEKCVSHPVFSGALPDALAVLVEYFPNGLLAPANLPKWFLVRTARLVTENSKTVESGYCGIASSHRGLRLLLVVQETRVAHRRVLDCSGLRRNRDRGNGPQSCAAAEICRRQIVGRAESPTVASQPRWISSAMRGQGCWGSLANDLVGALPRFKRLFAFSPLTLTLSPLRGEGIHGARLKRTSDAVRDTQYLFA